MTRDAQGGEPKFQIDPGRIPGTLENPSLRTSQIEQLLNRPSDRCQSVLHGDSSKRAESFAQGFLHELMCLCSLCVYLSPVHRHRHARQCCDVRTAVFVVLVGPSRGAYIQKELRMGVRISLASRQINPAHLSNNRISVGGVGYRVDHSCGI